MKSSIVLLIVSIVLLILVVYLIGIILRKKNDGQIASLVDKKDQLKNLPLTEELEAIYNLHLVGQSFDVYRTAKAQWESLETETLPQLEKEIEEVEVFNDTFHFIKVNKGVKAIEEELSQVSEEVKTLQEELSSLREQEEKNMARVKYALDLFEDLQGDIQTHESDYGLALKEITQQLDNIQAEFSQFVALNSSGDPVEAADVLEKAEEHTIALGQISEKIPAIVDLLQVKLKDQLDDLTTGYSKLLEEGYHFPDQTIESRFQTIREGINRAQDDLAKLELDKVELASKDIQERMESLYDLFDKEMTAHKEVKKTIRMIPSYFEHLRTNNAKLNDEYMRLSHKYILNGSESASLKSISRELERIEVELLPGLITHYFPEQPFTVLENVYGNAVKVMEKLEQDEQELLERLNAVEVTEQDARLFLDKTVNELHSIKRYMEKRHLPGIPQEFLGIFFTTSAQLEALMRELDRSRVDIQAVSKLLEAGQQAKNQLEETTYSLVQYATLTEQLLQYANRYRNTDANIQSSFETALQLFEVHYDYRTAFDEISYALEIVEPGVTERFVSSYEKTREHVHMSF